MSVVRSGLILAAKLTLTAGAVGTATYIGTNPESLNSTPFFSEDEGPSDINNTGRENFFTGDPMQCAEFKEIQNANSTANDVREGTSPLARMSESGVQSYVLGAFINCIDTEAEKTLCPSNPSIVDEAAVVASANADRYVDQQLVEPVGKFSQACLDFNNVRITEAGLYAADVELFPITENEIEANGLAVSEKLDCLQIAIDLEPTFEQVLRNILLDGGIRGTGSVAISGSNPAADVNVILESGEDFRRLCMLQKQVDDIVATAPTSTIAPNE